jgi:cysteine desulfurase family protein
MIYLDNAATTFPKPPKVYDEVLNCMRNYAANPGRSSHEMALTADLKIFETREILKDFINAPNAMNIVFTKNATESLNIAIKGVLKNGDHVISTQIEHNSVLRPLTSVAAKGVEITLLPVDTNGYLDTETIENNIKKNTKLILVNHASNVLGTLQDIGKIGLIAKNHGIIFMVDASQSIGVIPIDVIKNNIDILAFPGHKGLLAPQGVGGLYISQEIYVDSLCQGGTGSMSESVLQPDFLPDKFESGTLNTPGIVGLSEGIKFINKESIEKIRTHEYRLINFLIEELKKLSYVKIYGDCNYKNKVAVLSFNIDGFDCSEVGSILNQNGIAVRTGYHCAPMIHKIIGTEYIGTIRVSPGYFNTFHDIEILLNTIKKINSI